MSMVFLSHASDDKDIATNVCAKLRAKDVSVFFSPDSIQPAEHFPTALDRGLKNSKVLVLLVSKSALESVWVQEEVDTAANLGIKIIPVFLEPVEFPSFNPIAIHLKYVQRLAMYGDVDAEFERLINLIHERASPKLESQLVPDSQSAAGPAPAKADLPKQTGSSEPETLARPVPGASPKPKSRQEGRKAKTTAKSNEEFEALLERLSRDVDRGDKEAAYFLSRVYARGLYVERDDGRAVRYLQLASAGARCMPEAVHDLAEMYRLGKGVGKSGKKCIELHERAAKLSFAPSFYRLGRIYQQGVIAPRSLERAFRRFSVASRLGYPPADYRLAEIHWLGAGAEVDQEKAFSYAKSAADQHFPPALNLVGRFYRKGVHVEQDDAAACDWYEKAMMQGNPEGAYNLASMFKRGIGRPKDELKAQRYLDVASKLLAGGDPNVVLKDMSALVETVSDLRAHG